jgi:hypothetical protein
MECNTCRSLLAEWNSAVNHRVGLEQKLANMGVSETDWIVLSPTANALIRQIEAARDTEANAENAYYRHVETQHPDAEMPDLG